MERAAPKGERWPFKSEGSSLAFTLRKGNSTPMSIPPLEAKYRSCLISEVLCSSL